MIKSNIDINVKGYKATTCEEKTIAQAVAALTYTFANATVPKVNVITGNAYGSAYIAMNSKHIGADMVFAFESAKVGMMDAKEAVKIMYADELANASDQALVLNEKTNEYEGLQGSVEAAANRGYVDTIIEPQATRKNVIYALEMLFTKRESRPSKKHGTV